MVAHPRRIATAAGRGFAPTNRGRTRAPWLISVTARIRFRVRLPLASRFVTSSNHGRSETAVVRLRRFRGGLGGGGLCPGGRRLAAARKGGGLEGVSFQRPGNCFGCQAAAPAGGSFRRSGFGGRGGFGLHERPGLLMPAGDVSSFVERVIRPGSDGWQIAPPPPATGILIERLFRKHIRTNGDLGENQ